VNRRRSILEEAVDLQRRGEPFVLATVVWRRGPSSGQQGGKTIIRADGAMSGWIGGACATPTVLREARAALEDGRPRLLVLGPAGELDGALRPDVTAVPMACESEGAMELYLEPFLPPPGVVVVGRSPVCSGGGRRPSTTPTSPG
jgi:xanthine dehydrogenase accessory factor